MTIWLQMTSGRGPSECSRAVYHVMRLLIKEAEKINIDVNVLEIVEDKYPKTVKSALIALKGKNIKSFVNSWEGTVQWISQSPFRPMHKRKNWFLGISAFEPPKDQSIHSKDFIFETMKASGPGGQHVNKTNTAVRVIHRITGLTSIAQEERSQHMNKKLALTRLLKLIEEKQCEASKKIQQQHWEKHNDLERGNPVRVFGPA